MIHIAWPRWTSSQHPIVRRELGIWSKATRRWRWLGLLFIMLPIGCSAVCGLGLLAYAVEDGSAEGRLIALGLTAVVAWWSLQSFLTWGLHLLASIGASTLIARERENQNWALLRLTVLRIPDIVAAKVVGLLRWLRWPILAVVLLRALGALAAVVGVVALAYLAPEWLGALPPDIHFGLGVGGGLAAAGLGIFFVAELAISLLYNCAVGLVSSTFARSSGTAIALTFALHLGLGLLVFAPAQQVLVPLLGLVVNLMSPANASFVFPVTFGLFSFLLPSLLQAALTAAAFWIVLRQARGLAE